MTNAISQDLRGGPATQIRDFTVDLPTTSLEQAGNEPVPEEMVRDLLLRQWIPTSAAPRPLIVVKDDKYQANLRQSDVIVITIEGSYTEKYTGHRQEFADIQVPILAHIETLHSRQRMWNVMAECRRICNKWMLALRPFHEFLFDGFQPDYAGNNNFTGDVKFLLTAGALPTFARRVTGEESPNTDPALTPNGIIGNL